MENKINSSSLFSVSLPDLSSGYGYGYGYLVMIIPNISSFLLTPSAFLFFTW